jgi:hypothetical protein
MDRLVKGTEGVYKRSKFPYLLNPRIAGRTRKTRDTALVLCGNLGTKRSRIRVLGKFPGSRTTRRGLEARKTSALWSR